MSESPGQPLIDAGKLAEPLTKLVDAVRAGVGVWFEPRRVVRKAEAEAKAIEILARAEVKKGEIAERAKDRVAKWEIRRQANIEAVAQRAVDALPEAVSKDPIDDDWLHRFFDACKDVGDEQMQVLWGRLLAGEVERPGRFSPRALRIVQDMTKIDAAHFTQLCSFIWVLFDRNLKPVIPNASAPDVLGRGLGFSVLAHLDAIGLIRLAGSEDFVLRDIESAVLEYFGRRYTVASAQGKRPLNLGKVLLTDEGQELARIAGGMADGVACAMAISFWHTAGWTVTASP